MAHAPPVFSGDICHPLPIVVDPRPLWRSWGYSNLPRTRHQRHLNDLDLRTMMNSDDDDRIQFTCHVTMSRDIAPCGIDSVLVPCVCACADEVRFPKRREYMQEVQIWRPCVRRGGTQAPDSAKVSLFASCSGSESPYQSGRDSYASSFLPDIVADSARRGEQRLRHCREQAVWVGVPSCISPQRPTPLYSARRCRSIRVRALLGRSQDIISPFSLPPTWHPFLWSDIEEASCCPDV